MNTLNKNIFADSRIYLAGHLGMVGSAIKRELDSIGCSNILTRTRLELDLTCQDAVVKFFQEEKPDTVFLAAAKVGGILANSTYPAEFILENIAIQTNVLRAAYANGTRRLLFLGSSCIYPRDCPQPIREEYLLTGPLESTNRPYAVAKIAGIEMCWAFNLQYGTEFLAVMPTNLYGPNDNYDLNSSHVLPALIRKMHEAKQMRKPTVEVWGTGTARREFLHSDDLARACVFLMNLSEHAIKPIFQSPSNVPLLNIGCGGDLTIRELAELIAEIVGFEGRLEFDRSKPDGTPRKLLDVSRMKNLGWTPTISLRAGLESVYREFCSHLASSSSNTA